jgi:hypothetical protein
LRAAIDHRKGHRAGLVVHELSDQLRWSDDGDAALTEQLAVEVTHVVGHDLRRADVECGRRDVPILRRARCAGRRQAIGPS